MVFQWFSICCLLSAIAKFRFLNSCLSRICYPVTVLKTHYKKGLIWLWNWDFLIIFKHFALTLFLFWINLFSILWFLSSFVIKSYRSKAVLLLLRDNMHFLKAIITNAAAASKPHEEWRRCCCRERLKQLWKCIIDTTSSSSAFGGNLLLSAHFEY